MRKVILAGALLLGSAMVEVAGASSLKPYSNPRFEYAVDGRAT